MAYDITSGLYNAIWIQIQLQKADTRFIHPINRTNQRP